MTPLRERLVALIEATGPMGVADYMAACLFDPELGYYTTREPFGAGGDFTTAPEVSQMFGEIVAAWLAHGWRAMGAPSNAVVVEIGPGRGTLALDVQRTLHRIAPPLAGRLHLVEASPRLTDVQRERGLDATWHAAIDTLPNTPWLVVANELFDAVPARQFVAHRGQWVERCVGVADGALTFVLGPATLGPAKAPEGAGAVPDGAGAVPDGAGAVPDGTIREVAPAREAMMGAIAAHLARRDGLLLAVDYGHAGGLGDTLQAVRAHGYADPLEAPGRDDLTTHVDFAALATAAHGAGAHVLGLLSQGQFLLASGLLERAGALGAHEDEAGREAIRTAVERLAGPDAMGDLFRVLAISGRPRALPPFSSTPPKEAR